MVVKSPTVDFQALAMGLSFVYDIGILHSVFPGLNLRDFT